MNKSICSSGHEQIVYTGKNCPLCLAKIEIAQWEKEGSESAILIATLQKKIEELCDLEQWLEFRIEMAKADIGMYQNDNGKLWPNWEELVWGSRCKINAFELTLAKIKQIKLTEEGSESAKTIQKKD